MYSRLSQDSSTHLLHSRSFTVKNVGFYRSSYTTQLMYLITKGSVGGEGLLSRASLGHSFFFAFSDQFVQDRRQSQHSLHTKGRSTLLHGNVIPAHVRFHLEINVARHPLLLKRGWSNLVYCKNYYIMRIQMRAKPHLFSFDLTPTMW